MKVLTGRGPVWGVARGEVVLCLDIGKVIIKDVILIPDLDVDADLLSVAALLRSGVSITFDSEKASFLKDGILWGTAKPVAEGGLFFVDEYECVDEYALAMQCIDKQPFLTWHCRLGHINGRAIRSMTASGKVTGMEIGDPVQKGERNIDCADCLRGSQHQTISRYPFTITSRKLQRVSADLTGPMRVPDCTWGYRYLLVIIDHCTRYTWVFPLITKGMCL